MHDIPRRISEVLFELEAEMRVLGWWEEEMPPASALASQQPFCVDQLTFEQWLQWIFIPRMMQLYAEGLPFPGNCAVAPMAEEWVKPLGLEASDLIHALSGIDSLLSD